MIALLAAERARSVKHTKNVRNSNPVNIHEKVQATREEARRVRTLLLFWLFIFRPFVFEFVCGV